eukprot:1157895-Pelagomonas_calceolata.AAC.5
MGNGMAAYGGQETQNLNPLGTSGWSILEYCHLLNPVNGWQETRAQQDGPSVGICTMLNSIRPWQHKLEQQTPQTSEGKP